MQHYIDTVGGKISDKKQHSKSYYSTKYVMLIDYDKIENLKEDLCVDIIAV